MVICKRETRAPNLKPKTYNLKLRTPVAWRAFAPNRISAHRFSSLFKMASNKPLKIPLLRLASGRTQVDDRLGISLQKLAQRVPFRHIPHRHDFYHVAWIESGTGTFIRDDKSYPIKAGSLIFVPPGQVHTWESKEALHGYILSLEPTLLFSQTDRPHRLLHQKSVEKCHTTPFRCEHVMSEIRLESRHENSD